MGGGPGGGGTSSVSAAVRWAVGTRNPSSGGSRPRAWALQVAAPGSRRLHFQPASGSLSRSSGCLLPGASSAHPASAQLGWSWGVLSVCPPQPASREPRAAASGPGPLSAALCSGDGKSWRWRRFPSRAERAPGFSVLHATGACSSGSCWVPLSQGPTPGSFLHSCYSFASLSALLEGPRQGLELWVLKSA